MDEGEYRRVKLRLAAERLIRADRVTAGRDVSHLTFSRSALAAELAMHNFIAQIGRVTLAAHARHSLFNRRRQPGSMR